VEQFRPHKLLDRVVILGGGGRGGAGYFNGAAHSKPTEAVQDVARGFGQGFYAPPLLESTPLWRAAVSRGVIERGAPPALFWSVLLSCLFLTPVCFFGDGAFARRGFDFTLDFVSR
jgi:hypothetical protein